MRKIALQWSVWGAALLFMPGARAEVVVIVSPRSALAALNKEQVKNLYLGTEKEFPGGGVPFLTMLNGGSARDEFFAKILGMSNAQARGIWARLIFTGRGTAPKEGSAEEIKKLVSDNPNAIGIIDQSAVDATVKVVLHL